MQYSVRSWKSYEIQGTIEIYTCVDPMQLYSGGISDIYVFLFFHTSNISNTKLTIRNAVGGKDLQNNMTSNTASVLARLGVKGDVVNVLLFC